MTNPLIFTVAIDGPAAAGKGTISKGIAAHFGFGHLDTGLLYRAVGRLYLDGADPVAAARALTPADLTRHDLRTPQVAQAASKVSPDPAVRAQLVEFQREFAGRAGGAVLDGRDIGTVICPDADVKIFVTARADIRAQRRYEELNAKGISVTLEQVQEDMRARDARDSERELSPTKRADDAHLLDTSDMSARAALEEAIKLVDAEFVRAAQN